MPELPEVNFARNLLKRNCLGKLIRDVVAFNDEIVFEGVAAADFAAAMKGKTIVEANRHGKYLWLRMDSPPHPIFHFGMTGSFHVRGKEQMVYRRDTSSDKAEEWPPRFTKCAFTLADGTQVAFTNARRLGRIRLVTDPMTEKPLCDLGPDAHESLPDPAAFAAMLIKRAAPVKALLLDQSFLAGVGNWIADEVLYQSRIHPGQPANTLLRDEVEALHKALADVIDHAVKVDADYKHFPEDWLFHYRWGKGKGSSVAHGGHKIEFVTVGGRTSAVVVGVQKLHKRSAAENSEPGRPSAPKSKAARKVKAEGTVSLQGGDDNAKGRKRKNADQNKSVMHSSAKQEPAPKRVPRSTAIGAAAPDVAASAPPKPRSRTARGKLDTAATAVVVAAVSIGEEATSGAARKARIHANGSGEGNVAVERRRSARKR